MSLKIVAVHNRYQQRGGEDEVFEAEAQLLSDHGCAVRMVTEPASDPQGLKQKFEVVLNSIWSKRTHARFREILREEKPDIVHVHNFFPAISPSLYYACREAEVPVVRVELRLVQRLAMASLLFLVGTFVFVRFFAQV